METVQKNKIFGVKKALVRQYLRLLHYVTNRTELKWTNLLESDDFYQFVILGLSEAIERFDPFYGVKFETYAISRIRGMILDELRKLDFIPQSYRERIKKKMEEENRIRRENYQGEFALTD